MPKKVFTLYRAEGVLDQEEAKRKKIVILGLGSLGSEVAAQMAYEWERLILVDPDVLGIHNIERHHLGNSYLGQSKSHAMRDFLIREKGVPPESIKAYKKTDKYALRWWGDVDLVICCIDNQVPCRQLNDWCIKNNVPAIYGGVYPKGVGGEVISIPNPREVCYLCAENSRGAEILIPETFGNYGIDPALVTSSVDDNPKAVSALAKSVIAIAGDVVYTAWKMLFPEGDEIKPTLLYHPLEGFIEVMQVKSGSSQLKAIAQMIAARQSLHLTRDLFKLEYREGGWYSVLVSIPWPKQIEQWTRCPMHGQTVRISDL